MAAYNTFKHFFQNLDKLNDSDYKVTLEVTHHGPFIKTPSLFIEIGSTEKEWKDPKAGEVIAKTIIDSIKTFKKTKKYKIAFGIGGPHYSPNFNNIQLGDKFALSHVMPEYSLPLTENLLNELKTKTVESIGVAVVDWKGIGKADSRNKVGELLEKSGLEIIRTKDAKK